MEPATTTFLDYPTLLSSTAFAIATIGPSMNPPSNSFEDMFSGHPPEGPPGGPHGPPPPNGECSLLGPFALLVQGALGLLALSSLVFKRWRERPQRPLKTWSFDVSKQVVGSILVHIANLVMSMLSSGQLSVKVSPETVSIANRLMRRMEDTEGHYQPNPCSFYLLNLAIDTTIGIPILIILVRVFTALFTSTPLGNPPESLRSGNYGSPPKTWWWAKQCIIYFLGLLGMKFCVLVIFLLLPWISRIGDWALRWTEGNEDLQVFFVMLFFPLIMNATQYYIIDTFIKNQNPEHEPLPSDDEESSSGEGEDRGTFEGRHSSEDSSSVVNEEVTGAKEAIEVKTKPVNKKKHGSKDRHDYDPQTDGDSSPTVVGSGSHSDRGALLGNGVDRENVTKPVDW